MHVYQTIVVSLACAVCVCVCCGMPVPGRTGSTVPNLCSCFLSHLLAGYFFSFLCVCLTTSLWNALFFSSLFPLFLKKTCSNLRHLQLYALSATAVRPRGALLRTCFCLFPASDLTSLLFPCRSSLRVLVLNLVENQICFHCALFFAGLPPFTPH